MNSFFKLLLKYLNSKTCNKTRYEDITKLITCNNYNLNYVFNL